MRSNHLICGVVLSGLLAAPATQANIIIRDAGDLQVGVPLIDSGRFRETGTNLFGLRFNLLVDVTQSSGWSLTVDSFGSMAHGTDTELALYDGDGTFLFAINDDFEAGVNFDAYLGFGDAMQPSNPHQGTTVQSGPNFVNQINLLAGTYLAVIGPFNTVWDELDVRDSIVDNQQGTGQWECMILLIPTPASAAMLGMAALVLGTRRRRT